jgi:ribosomal subunit interface protein
MSGRKTTVPPPTVEVQVRGPVADEAVDYASEKVRHVIEYANQPVLVARVVLTMAQDPAVERPARAETSLDVSGTQVRAHAVASDMTGAVDLLEDKLRENLLHHQDRERTRHRWIGVSTEGEWRHGTLPTSREAHFPRPPEEREVMRRKTFAVEPMTADEAAFEMDLLAHDFYLFTDRATGEDSVVFRDDGGWHVIGDGAVLSEQEAISKLELSGSPFVLYRDTEAGRGRVVYVRYDGHYGLITAT